MLRGHFFTQMVLCQNIVLYYALSIYRGLVSVFILLRKSVAGFRIFCMARFCEIMLALCFTPEKNIPPISSNTYTMLLCACFVVVVVTTTVRVVSHY